MKKKIKSHSHNASIRPSFKNKETHIRMTYQHDDGSGYDNGIFIDLGIHLKNKKRIVISGKDFSCSPFVENTDLFLDQKGNRIKKWWGRIWPVQNLKLNTLDLVGEMTINYVKEDWLGGTGPDLCFELFINDENFNKFEDNILKSNKKFIKNLDLDMGIYVDEKKEIRDKEKNKKFYKTGKILRGFPITHYDITFTPK